MRLIDLSVGDRFYPASKKEKATHIFKVVNKDGHFIECLDLKNGNTYFKRKSLDVIRSSYCEKCSN